MVTNNERINDVSDQNLLRSKTFQLHNTLKNNKYIISKVLFDCYSYTYTMNILQSQYGRLNKIYQISEDILIYIAEHLLIW